MIRSWPIALAVTLAWLPDVALACPVCFQAKNDASRLAFLVTTLFMTLLPLGLFGGVAYWVKRRSDALDAEDCAGEAGEPAADRLPEEPRGPGRRSPGRAGGSAS